jgi:serine/threonine-protein phosphatase 2A regulatory subunit B''
MPVVCQVIARMYYCANRSWSGRLTIPEIRRSQIVSAVRQLEVTADINQVTQFFSYEHFYVIYCKFWELDRDHDLYIDRNDLARHNDHGMQLTPSMSNKHLTCPIILQLCPHA